jgi:hypothetical protein
VVVRNALTFDATLNPDFSQVESDDPQVTINQRFEVFFPEKRPFFIENAGFFQTPINLFFSRRIVDPEFGGRLTGKMGPWALGVLAADDRAAGRQLAAADPLRGERAVNGAFRLQRELGSQSMVGLLATTRAFGSGLNQVVALDSRLQLSANWSLTGQVAASHERRRDGQQLDGTASFTAAAGGEHFSYLGSYAAPSPGFRFQLGFIQRVDIAGRPTISNTAAPQGAASRLRPQRVRGRELELAGTAAGLVRDRRLRDGLRGPCRLRRVTKRGVRAIPGHGIPALHDGRQRLHRPTEMAVDLGLVLPGTGINYSPPDELMPFLGDEVTGTASLTLRPTPRLRLDQTFLYSRLATRPGSLPPGVAQPGVIFRDQLWRTRINYQFSKAFSIRAILDYDDTFTNPALIADSPLKRWRGDVLLTYLANPGTALYVGYTDRYDDILVDPITPPARRGPARWTSTVRQFFVKVSYLFRY